MEWAVETQELVGSLMLITFGLVVCILLTYPKKRGYFVSRLRFKTRYPEKVTVKSLGEIFSLKATSRYRNFKIQVESDKRSDVKELVSEFKEVFIEELLSEVKTNYTIFFKEGAGTLTFTIPAKLAVVIVGLKDQDTGEEIRLDITRQEPWWAWLIGPAAFFVPALVVAVLIGFFLLIGIHVTFV